MWKQILELLLKDKPLRRFKRALGWGGPLATRQKQQKQAFSEGKLPDVAPQDHQE